MEDIVVFGDDTPYPKHIKTMIESMQLMFLEQRALVVLTQLDDEVIDFDMLHSYGNEKVVMTIYPVSCAGIISEIFNILTEYREMRNVTEPDSKEDNKDVCEQDNSLKAQESR